MLFSLASTASSKRIFFKNYYFLETVFLQDYYSETFTDSYSNDEFTRLSFSRKVSYKLILFSEGITSYVKTTPKGFLLIQGPSGILSI